jgi:hypothetical protein
MGREERAITMAMRGQRRDRRRKYDDEDMKKKMIKG